MMGSSGLGSRSSYLDPDHVFALVISRRPHDLFRYLDSIAGASEDLHCYLVSLAGRSLLSRSPSRAFPNEDSRALHLARYAWVHAASSRLRAPQKVHKPFNFASDAGHYMHPLNSSSHSGRMLTIQEPDMLRHAAMLNQLPASSSRIPAATFPPLQENSNDVLKHAAMLNQLSASRPRIPAVAFPPLPANWNDVNNFPIRCAEKLDETSAFHSGTHASAYVPLRDDSTLAQAFAELSMGQPGSEQITPHQLMQNIVHLQELEQNNHGTPAVGVLSMRHPGSEQFTPQMLMQNREVLPIVDIKGKKPASEVDQLKAKILRLNVASLISEDGTKGAAGVLIRDVSTAQFIRASCFTPILCMEPSLLFAAACCKGIKSALSFQPIIIVLESHLLPLLNPLYYARTPHPELEQLSALMSLKPPDFVVWSISEESNRAACQLALYVLQMGESNMIFNDPPAWLVPYLAGCQNQ